MQKEDIKRVSLIQHLTSTNIYKRFTKQNLWNLKCKTNVRPKICLDLGLDHPENLADPRTAKISWPTTESFSIDIPSPGSSSFVTSPSTSSTNLCLLSTSPRHQGLTQTTLRTFIKMKAKMQNDDPRARAINQKIGEMICLNNQPFSLNESPWTKVRDPKKEIFHNSWNTQVIWQHQTCGIWISPVCRQY